MSDLNRVFLMGRLGSDLELKQSATGVPYVKINLATNNHRQKDGVSQKSTHWHRVVAFGKTAENCAAYLRKGSQVMVEGALEVQTYSDKEDRKITRVSVLANNVSFVSSRPTAHSAVVGEFDEMAGSA